MFRTLKIIIIFSVRKLRVITVNHFRQMFGFVLSKFCMVSYLLSIIKRLYCKCRISMLMAVMIINTSISTQVRFQQPVFALALYDARHHVNPGMQLRCTYQANYYLLERTYIPQTRPAYTYFFK